MANYVSNKVICSKTFFENYFLDPYTLGEEYYERCKKNKYISFNKFFGVKDLKEYIEKYGQQIDYGYFYEVKELDENNVSVTFQTRNYYPICAIKKAIEIDHTIVWYAVEDSISYISKFLWKDDKVIELTLNIANDDFYDFYDHNTYKNIHESDDEVWYYDFENKEEWIEWKTNDLTKRYKTNRPGLEYLEWYKHLKTNF